MPKLTKKLREGLELLAGVMPEDHCREGQKVSGRTLLDEGMLTTSKGEQVDPLRTYRRLAKTGRVNHGRRLGKAYEQGGRKAVLAYCQPYIEPEHFATFSARLSELVPA